MARIADSKRHVGMSLPRKEGRPKVSGKATYIDDMEFHQMLHGITVRSPVPRGRLKAIHFPRTEGVAWDEFVIVTAEDIPGVNNVALIFEDQPMLASGVINHTEEPVALLAHADREMLEKARQAVRLEIEPMTAVLDLDDSDAQGTIICGKDNVLKSYSVNKGDVDKGFAEAAFVVEGEYRTGAQEHAYIETNGVIARWDDKQGLVVWGSIQCPYYVKKALVKMSGLAENRVRVVQVETGGGFGGKEEYPSLIAGHAALLARKAKRPVKMIYDRVEDMVATTKRHPSRTRHRTALDKDGRLLAMDIDFVLDGGAYVTLSSVVLSRGTLHACGPYYCPNIRIRSRAVATNTPPHGAFRGFGAPQSVFAMERHMDEIARVVGLSPDELRRRNYIKDGQTTATGQVIKDRVDVTALQERALEMADYRAKRARFERENASKTRVRRGVGFASFLHGAGFTGSGERMLASVAGVEGMPTGRVRVLAANTEIGQGKNTVFAQIAADALGLPYDMIDVAEPDTAVVPNSGPTVASRTTMVVGNLVHRASEAMRKALVAESGLNSKYTAEQFRRAVTRYIKAHGHCRFDVTYQEPEGIRWDDSTYQGDAYGTFAWATYVAEVSVDMVTFETKVEDFVALQEIGKVVNPTLAEGQIQGGVTQGIGWAVSEKIVWKDGRMANPTLSNYVIPTALDTPPIRVAFEEVPYAHGPQGAKGIGELPLDGSAAAVASAIEHALGARVTSIPATPEVLFERMKGVRS